MEPEEPECQPSPDGQEEQELEKKEEDLRHRPVWQRLLLPFVGLLCMVVALISGFIPLIPGWPLALIGLPLLAAFNPRYEAWVRRKMRQAWTAIRRRLHLKKKATRHQAEPEVERPPSRRVYRRREPSPSPPE